MSALTGQIVLCPLLTLMVFGVVAHTLKSHGLGVQCTTCMYIMSLCVTQLLVKELQSGPVAFRFPAWLTVSHMLSTWFVCVVYCWKVGDLRMFNPRTIGSVSRYMVAILPIAVSVPISIVLNNKALLYIGAGLASIISTLAPVTTALLASALGRRLSGMAWVGIAIALGGAMIIAHDECRSSVLFKGDAKHMVGMGVLFAGLAVLWRSSKNVLQDKLLNSFEYGGTEGSPLLQKESISPMHVCALAAPPMFLISVGFAIGTEDLTKAVLQLTARNIGIVLGTCVCATAVNLLSAVTIKAVGASSMQMLGTFNVVVTAAISWGFMGEALSSKVVSGAVVLLAGIIVFQRGEGMMEAAREKGEDQEGDDRSTTVSDDSSA